MSELATHLVAYVDSRYAVEGTDTHFSFVVNLPKMNQFDSVCVLQAAIPKSYYLIAPGYNTFTLVQPGFDYCTVTIPVGNYSRRSLQRTLTTSLNTAAAQSGSNWVYTVTSPGSLDPETGKYTYTVSGNNNAQPSFVFPNLVQPSESMGFRSGSVNTFTNNQLVSVNVCRLQAKSTLYIKSNCVDNGGSGVLQDILGSDPDFSVITFKVGDVGGIEANRKELQFSRTNHFVFVITDEDDVVLDTNGLSVTMSLLFWDSKRYKVSSQAK